MLCYPYEEKTIIVLVPHKIKNYFICKLQMNIYASDLTYNLSCCCRFFMTVRKGRKSDKIQGKKLKNICTSNGRIWLKIYYTKHFLKICHKISNSNENFKFSFNRRIFLCWIRAYINLYYWQINSRKIRNFSALNKCV